jgi:predicted ABC-type ATPase
VIKGAKLIEFDDVPPHLMEEAKALIESIVCASKTIQSISTEPYRNEPTMIHMCGIPGSGKTTYTSQFLSENPNYSLVQFDTVMEGLSGYQSDRELYGLAEAFRRWELPARAIGYHLLQALVDNERNIFFDHSATNRQHLALIQAVRERGYVVEMHYIDCSPTEASRRVIAREQRIKRHTPPALIHERHELLQELVPSYEGLVDRFVRL